jgi:hypothetical protein
MHGLLAMYKSWWQDGTEVMDTSGAVSVSRILSCLWGVWDSQRAC